MNISVMMDVGIIAVLVLCTALGWKRGLLRTLAELAVVVLALLLSAQIARAAAPKIVDAYLRPATHAAIEQRAAEISEEAEGSSKEKLHKVLEAIPNAYVREKAAETLDGLFESGEILGGYGLAPLSELGKDLADEVLDTLVEDLIRSVLCGALFVVLSVLLRLVVRVLRLVEKIPGVRQLNELGGALAGLGKGVILVCLAVWVLERTGTVTPDMAAESVMLGFLPGWIGGMEK